MKKHLHNTWQHRIYVALHLAHFIQLTAHTMTFSFYCVPEQFQKHVTNFRTYCNQLHVKMVKNW